MLTSAQTNQFTDLFGDKDLIYNAHVSRTTQHTEVSAAMTVAVFTVQYQQTSSSIQIFLLILSNPLTSQARS